MIFVFKKLKHFIARYYSQYLFYKKSGSFLPSGCVVEGCSNIEIGKHFSAGINCQLYSRSSPSLPSSIRIDDRVSLNSNVHINAESGGQIFILSDVLIGPNVVIRAANHNSSRTDLPIRNQGSTGGKIKIEDNVWIGAGCIILANITIGRGSVIGAGSIVTKDIPPDSVAFGSPARVVRSRIPNNA